MANISSIETEYDVKPNKGYFHDLTFPLKVTEEYRQENTSTHAHEFIEMVVILKGTGLHVTPVETRRLSRGDVFIIPIGKEHRYQEVDGLELINVLYYPQKLTFPRMDLCSLPGYDVIFSQGESPDESYAYAHLEDKELKQIEKYLHILKDEFAARKLGYRTRTLGIFMYLIGLLAPMFANSQVSRQDYHQPAIEKVINYLEDHFDQNVTIAELTRVASMSRSSLMREFVRLMGTSPMQYLINIRLDAASHLLREYKSSIMEIAFRVGFPSTCYFTRRFTQRFHVSPSQFRKNLSKN